MIKNEETVTKTELTAIKFILYIYFSNPNIAARCFDKVTTGERFEKKKVRSKVYVYLDMSNSSRTALSDSKKNFVSVIYTHDEYATYENRQIYKNNIALLKLESNVQFSDSIKPICLQENSEKIISGSMTFAGFGMKSFIYFFLINFSEMFH